MPAASTNRQIRVFVSSTFTDMKADRDYLVKFIFPQLRKLCEERAVMWTEVDLRWGVTNDATAQTRRQMADQTGRIPAQEFERQPADRGGNRS